MNKEKEFEEKILNKLLVDLKDIDKYKSFKNGSFIYDLGYYQGNLLVNEIDRLNNIINGLEKYIHNELILDFYNDDMPCELIINKMEKIIKELKENNKYE